MFSYELPDGLKSITYVNSDGRIKFDPPVYEQRYAATTCILSDTCWGTKFKKIVDFGCAEMKMLTRLRRQKYIEHILEVDVDESILSASTHRAVPLISDYLQKRETPLRIEVYKGSIDASVECLRDVDAVVALEIIEHLYPVVLENIPYNIFGFVQPKLAIFSTPNSEFNVLFEPLLENGFRHLDHKFEWTRKEFRDWAHNICLRFPNYEVSIIGVGNPLPERKNIGYVTQIAIFARIDILGKDLVNPLNSDIPADFSPEVQYKEIFAVDFPVYSDDRTKEQKIFDELRYHLERCRRIDRYFNRERQVFQVPLNALKSFVQAVGGTEEEMLGVLLKFNYNVEEDFVVLPEHDEDVDNDHDADEDNFEELSSVANICLASEHSEEDWD